MTELLSLLSSYPLWARIVVLICAVVIVAVGVFARRGADKPEASVLPTQHGVAIGNQSAGTINNVFAGAAPSINSPANPSLSPAQDRLLGLLAEYQHRYVVYKLVVGRDNGRLFFDGDPKKGEDVSLIRDLFGAIDPVKQAEFVRLLDTMPSEYLRVFPRDAVG